MRNKIKELCQINKEFILYVSFGVFTTVVNIAVFWFAADILKIHYLISNALAWIAAVIYAYITNRIWVFKSDKHGFHAILKEMSLFVGARLISGIGDMLIMFLFVDLLKLGNLPGKITSQVFVVIFNYVFSKLIIFRNSKR